MVKYKELAEGWLSALPPPEEKERLARIRSYEILDSTPEESFDRVTRLAAQWFKVPFALVSLVDENRQWFKSCIGINATETDRDVAFCSHALWEDEVLVIPDATKDERFRGNPLVTGDMHIRFYAGAQLKASDGLKLGTLCVIDQTPREFTQADGQVLAALAALVIDEMDLRLARLKAEEENDRKSQYVAYMSHEVRTPLTTIETALSLMRDKSHDEETKQYLKLIGQATGILMETINDFLDVARLETHAVELERIPFRPDVITEQVAELMRLRAKHGVTLEVEKTGRQDVTLLGDPTRLRQIMMNFVSNAVKFTDRGKVRIVLRLADEGKEKVRLKLKVQDSGIGIAPNRLSALFKKFSQVESSTSRRYGGSGLGLHICKNLAELMGGSVGAESIVGTGSTFWFEAPFSLAHTLSEQTPQAPTTVPSRHILLVEDTKANQILLSALLRKHGHTVAPAFNGLEAVEMAENQPFDLILMDCQMPEMDGFEATGRIRANPHSSNRSTPIVALTANAGAGERERCLGAGMDDYLTKPVTIEALQQMIGRWTPAEESPAILKIS